MKIEDDATKKEVNLFKHKTLRQMMKTLVSMILIVLSCNFLHLHVLNCADAHCLQNCNKMCLSLKDAVRPHPHHKARGKVE